MCVCILLRTCQMDAGTIFKKRLNAVHFHFEKALFTSGSSF